MTDVETRRALMTNRKLDELAKGYARDILAEVKKNGGDAYDLAHEYANGSQWVCYYDRAHELCRNCDIDDGWEYARNKQPHAKSYNDMAADIAYGELHARILRAIDDKGN